MLHRVKFNMLPNVTHEKVRETVMAWERESMENPNGNYEIIGKYGYYGSRSGFYLISAPSPDHFYPMIKWFQEIFIMEVQPIHTLDDFYSSQAKEPQET